jgi:predicted membrane protein
MKAYIDRLGWLIKKMKMKNRKLIIAVLILFTTALAQAQEFKIAKTSGRLEIHLGKVTVEGHNGNEIIFSSRQDKASKDKRAEGLRTVNSLGLEDNTGLGINVTTKGDVIEVYQLKKTSSPDIRVLVPKGVIVSFEHESQYGGDAVFKNIENEIEVSAQYNSVQLENVTGPVTVKSIYGGVEATFGSVIKDPVSIVSVYGFVDVTLPETTKANLKLSTSYGEILVAPEFKIDINREGTMINMSDKVSGKINGGGVNIDLAANYGKIYLRKK